MRFLFISILFFATQVFGQVKPKDSVRKAATEPAIVVTPQKTEAQVVEDIEKANAPAKVIKLQQYNPTKAGLYSAVLPGLGQFYNKKYWKVPLVWGAVGVGVGIAIWNDNRYKEYRGYYIDKLNGTPNEFLEKYPNLDKVALANIQDRAKRQRDYAIAGTALVYLLNIIDAVVDAHLYEGRNDPDLAIQPSLINDGFSPQGSKAGITLSYTF